MFNKTIHNLYSNNILGVNKHSNSFLMIKIASKLTTTFKEKLKSLNLSPKLAGILMIVIQCKNISQKELGDQLNIDRTSITKLIDELENLNMIERIQDKTNRRANQLNLTEEGMKLTDKIFSILKDIEEKAFAFLSEEEKDQLTKILKKVNL